MRRLLVTACLVLALGGITVVFAILGRSGARGPLSRDASLLLLGMTNISAGTFGVFCLSNGTRMHIACVPEAFEQPSASAWVRTPLTGRVSPAVRDWIGVREELKPGDGFTFMVPAPTTNGAWRLVFMCQERALLVDPVTDTVRHLADTNAMKTQLRQFSGRRYYVTSPQVAP